MATYVLMTKLGPSGIRDPRGRRSAGRAWLKKVGELAPGLKWIAHYTLLGPYDFMDIYETDDPEMPFRVSLLSRELGAVTAESWPAMTYEEFLPVAERVDEAVERHSQAPPGGGKKKK
jgi:uncharacterized protein with GYD domain